MKWLDNLIGVKQHKIDVEYKEIPKPDKDHILVFHFPDDMKSDMLIQATKLIEDCSTKKKVLLVPKSITITTMRHYNWQLKYKNEARGFNNGRI